MPCLERVTGSVSVGRGLRRSVGRLRRGDPAWGCVGFLPIPPTRGATMP